MGFQEPETAAWFERAGQHLVKGEDVALTVLEGSLATAIPRR